VRGSSLHALALAEKTLRALEHSASGEC
jgi:hypothetical protein